VQILIRIISPTLLVRLLAKQCNISRVFGQDFHLHRPLHRVSGRLQQAKEVVGPFEEAFAHTKVGG
jgi:hypothetical protein